MSEKIKMSGKVVIECPNCSKKVRVPEGKHIKFVCPNCSKEIEFDDSKDNVEKNEPESSILKKNRKLRFLIHFLLFLFAIILAIPLYVGYYQWLMWIPIPNFEIRILIIGLLFVLVIYFLLVKLKKLAFFILLFMGIKMGYNEFYNRRGVTFEKVLKTYQTVVSDNFNNNPNILFDLNNEAIMSVEKGILNSVDYSDSRVKQYANKISVEYFTDDNDSYFRRYGNIVRYFSIFKTINGAWKYVQDPENHDDFARASESLNSMAGDCEDYSIIMSSCIKAVGGRSQIVLVDGHAFPVVWVAKNKYDFNRKVKPLIKRLFADIDNDKLGVLQNDDGIWLSFDYTRSYPGGPFLNKDVIKLIKV